MNTQLFPVVILVGGLATRLRPLTETLPKALIEINGEPFILHQLRLLQKKGIRKIVLCVGYLGEQIKEVVRDGTQFNLQVEYSFDGPVLLGTAGAVKQALSLLEDAFFILYGDSYLSCDYLAVQNAFIRSQKSALMTVFCNLGQWDKSNVEFADGNILVYDKNIRTNRMHYIDYGLGLFHKQAFELVPESKPFDLAMLYQNLLKQQQLAGFEVDQRFYEIGSFIGIQELQQHLLLDASLN